MFSFFIVNGILEFFSYCYYSVYTDMVYMIYYSFLMILTNSLSEVLSKLRSCFYVFHVCVCVCVCVCVLVFCILLKI